MTVQHARYLQRFLLCVLIQASTVMSLLLNSNSYARKPENLSSNFVEVSNTWLDEDRRDEHNFIFEKLDEGDDVELFSKTFSPIEFSTPPSSTEHSDTNCSDPLDHVEWSDADLVGSFAVLILINILVVAGNTLVIAAVFTSTKLRSVTNLFIVSLAVADMSLGIMVLPFSVTVEVFDTWLFGPLWCSVWLAVDVWMSTSSILNLVVISFDRYVAVTRPVSYPNLMTSTRAKILIGVVWVTSFVICFPPLVGWNDKHQTLASSGASCHLTCELTNEIGYVLYSALGSFFLPMFVMMFFYWKIYLAAAETTKAINRGFKTTRDQKDGTAKRFDDHVTLRIHRGKNSSERSRDGRPMKAHYAAVRKTKSESLGPQNLYDAPANVPHDGVELVSIEGNRKTKARLIKRQDNLRLKAPPRLSVESTNSTQAASGGSDTSGAESSTSCHNGSVTPTATRSASRMGRRNIKMQVKRFRMETKAAKTLGIIVGVFIMCWLPFFCMYLVRGFCPTCINPLLFSVLFWLGYCNSAINPFIYALFSKDFRFAFKKILCKCVCQKVRSKGIVRAPTIYVPSYGEESEESKPVALS
ncbi:probable G-protein coupled receptor No9 [Hyalella azteca]|uniref:Probable G-protein coupled receptor No9 n=1 Tax=Hyalella azteca TaxID=294128 RepID=A0A8B7P3Y9_HYAAZ|nr:probable G-protein coupled receptor No9 [Hyalella azteca]